MPRSTFSNGAVVSAAFLAGPLFVAGIAVGQWTTDLAQPIALQAIDLSGTMALIGGIIVFAVPIGALLAIAPIMLGSYVLGQLGRHNPAFTLPIVWALVGCLIPLLPLAATNQLAAPDVRILASGLITACGGCALISRWRARWDDWTVEALLVERHRRVATVTIGGKAVP